jgi:IS30 family transposase
MTIYCHLSPEERAVIMIERNNDSSIRKIAQVLNRSASTISRELKRNTVSAKLTYCAKSAKQQYDTRRDTCVKPIKLIADSPLYNVVKHHLIGKQWSPEQISGTLKKQNPEQINMQVSHETIYRCIYAHPAGELKKMMIKALRRRKSKRGPRGSKSSNYNSVKVADDQFIHCRPEDIEERKVPGHWEGDLIAGSKNQSCVGTLVERSTGYLILSKMKSKSAENVRLGFEKQMKTLPDFLRTSMTYDRGSEMSQHKIMSKNLSMKIYFADPHSPWQRGSNENTNGLIRQYLPKGEDLSVHSQADLDKIAWLLNTRPRKRYGFSTPQEMIGDVLIKSLNPVALGN